FKPLLADAMPALIAFGRRWRIGSDDFVFPGLTEALVRFSWVVLGSIFFVCHYPLQCDKGPKEELTVYLAVLLLLNTSTTLLCLIMARISARGAIMEANPRKPIATLLYVRVPLFFFEIVWTTIATVAVFGGYNICNFIVFLRVVVCLEWALIAIVVIGLLVVFNPMREEEMSDRALISRRSWTRTFNLLKIKQDSLMRSALEDIANLMSSFFVGQDLVASDIAAGLLLVVHSPNNEYPPTKADIRAVPPWMTPASALHFLHFATCVYGWTTYLMYNRSVAAYTALAKSVKCCSGMRCDQVLVVEDNCCMCNTASLQLATRGRNVDLFYVSFRNRLYETPFVVLADHDSHSVVIAIRGSCSLIDLVTDLTLDDEVLSVDVDTDPVLAGDHTLDSADGSEVRVHRGMLRTARYIFDTLRKKSVLEDLYVLNPGYQLVVCGHSLGAGVASLLTLLLKQQYPSVRCYSFSPPGCVISENGQSEMEAHVMSVVSGDDVVPRMSYQSMHKLRENVEMELRQTTRAKYEILIKGFFRLFFHAPWELTSPPLLAEGVDTLNLIGERTASVGYGTETPIALQMPEERIQQCLGKDGGSASSTEVIEMSERSTPCRTPTTPPPASPRLPPTPLSTTSSIFTITKAPERTVMHPPGRCLYVSLDPIEGSKDTVPKSEWIDFRCLTEVKLSASAMTDHLPKSVANTLERLVETQHELPPPAAVVVEQPQPLPT
ncbi:hypothetical protein PENTCL1PPCAC_9622, partial [Pristionchus entomophagus]